MTTNGEKIRQAASDMGFDDHRHMLDFLDGVGLEVVEKGPETEWAKRRQKTREVWVLSAAVAFATHPQFDQGLDDKHNLTWRPYLLTAEDAAKEAVALWNAVQKVLAEQ